LCKAALKYHSKEDRKDDQMPEKIRQGNIGEKKSSINRLKEVLDEYWEFILEKNVHIRIQEGLKISELPPASYEGVKLQVEFARTILDILHQIEPSELEYEEQVAYKILEWEILQEITLFEFFWLQFPVVPYSSPIRLAHRTFVTYRLFEERDLEDYLNLLKKYPSFLDDVHKRLVEQQKRDILLPKEEINLVVSFLKSFVREPEKSLFFVEFSRLEKINPTKIEEFQKKIGQVIVEDINPTFERLINFLSGDYKKAAPDEVGVSQYPGGKDYYRYLVEYYTNQPITPEEVHKIGLREVKRIDTQMRQIQEKVGFQGSLNEFFLDVKKDPRFYAKTPEEVGERLTSFIREIEPKIKDYFKTTPKAPYQVKRLDPNLEASLSYGYYEVPTASEPTGTYYYNGSNLDQQFLIDSAGLVYHELIPGHHFQLALQLEAKHLPEAQKKIWTSAYTEGWAEYASMLAKEMGLYDNPYDLYGRSLRDKFFAVRLVVDTGLNYYGWSREKAVNYMKENQYLATDAQIYSESLRYSVDMPGQALAYKMGSLKIWELREKAEKALGIRFDIRKFHDAMIGYGAMPLSVLEWHIDNFIEKELTTSASD
jgi:uncharacterized protein (DUF885 family)